MRPRRSRRSASAAGRAWSPCASTARQFCAQPRSTGMAAPWRASSEMVAMRMLSRCGQAWPGRTRSTRPTQLFLDSSCRRGARAQACGATLAPRQNRRRRGNGGRLAARAMPGRRYDVCRRLNTGTLPARATWIGPPWRAFSWPLLQATETEAERRALRRPLFRLFFARPSWGSRRCAIAVWRRTRRISSRCLRCRTCGRRAGDRCRSRA